MPLAYRFSAKALLVSSGALNLLLLLSHSRLSSVFGSPSSAAKPPPIRDQTMQGKIIETTSQFSILSKPLSASGPFRHKHRQYANHVLPPRICKSLVPSPSPIS